MVIKRAAHPADLAVQALSQDDMEGMASGLPGTARLRGHIQILDPDDKKPEKAGKTEKRRWVVIALILCAIYYAALAFIKIPYITIGILSFAYTFSTFEVVTVVFLIAMMIFMGVRKIPVLVFVPIGTTLFLSLAFRTFLHVLLP